MKSEQVISRVDVIAAADVAAGIVMHVDGTVGADKGIGVTEFAGKSGQAVALVTGGVVTATSGAAFSAGAILISDANGKVIAAPAVSTKTLNTVYNTIGYAMEAATAANQQVLVWVQPYVFVRQA